MCGAVQVPCRARAYLCVCVCVGLCAPTRTALAVFDSACVLSLGVSCVFLFHVFVCFVFFACCYVCLCVCVSCAIEFLVNLCVLSVIVCLFYVSVRFCVCRLFTEIALVCIV